ncbi:MAG: isoleucine--tRNA ligase [Candidatus Woesebacteria bacterium]
MKNLTQFTPGRPDFAKLEEDVLQFWDDTDAFNKSVENRPADNPYIFYDGPPFANGLPHYGHLLSSTSKDVIARYHTMKGKRVERVWGWDCHGVPIENAIEKELGLKGGKKGIEELGIHKFNEACRASIMTYDKEWKKTIKRLGRWVDFEHAYKTMDTSYMESVWWGFQQLYEKGLIYQGRKVILYCPRCSTPLSNFEIAMDNSYKDVEDWSVYVKFSVKKGNTTKNEYLIAWTTTPWTLPGNVALAVLPKAEYVLLEHLTETNEKEYYWVAKDRMGHIQHLLGAKKPEVIKTVKGKELSGMEYEPLYTYMPLHEKKAYYVTIADFVSLEDGSGIVHTAAIFGEDDYKLAQEKELPCVPTLDDQGKFLDFVTPLAGQFYKKTEDWVVSDLKDRGLVLDAHKFVHSYPFCYRCGTPLYYNALPAWFINVQKLKPDLIKANERINWFPEHLKYGRFGKGIETAPDWNISRSRYWGTPMPIWEAKKGTEVLRRVVGSIEELKKWAVDLKKAENLTDLHREYVDEIEVWVDDAKTIKGKRVFEVFDCWVESGSMPFAQIHYPFANKQKFEDSYPAQFITEYIAQTRAWFYCMHVLSVGIFGTNAFENCLTTGTILAEDGTKMSKSKKNYPDPSLVIEKYGVDSLRLYLMSSTIMKGENLNFSEKGVHEIQNKVINILWNMYGFYSLYAKPASPVSKVKTVNYQLKTLHVMDRWLLSRTAHLVWEVTVAMDAYDVVSASRRLMEFTQEFSTWYVRLSRSRLKEDTYPESKEIFARTLITICKLFASFIPFTTEIIYQSISGSGESIHLTDWPDHKALAAFVDVTLEEQMARIQLVTEKAHAARKDKGIKVRQPLAVLKVFSPGEAPESKLLDVLASEVNVEKIEWKVGKDILVKLDTKLTPELIEKGQMREVIRQIQDLRKETPGIAVGTEVDAWLPDWPDAYTDEIRAKTMVRNLSKGEPKIIAVG